MFTRNRRGKLFAQRSARSVVHAARAAAGREVWIREALRELRAEPGAERCGVWLESSVGEERAAESAMMFRGEVWESGEAFPAERWSRLSLERPVPVAMLSTGKVAEFTQSETSSVPILGPAMGMGHGLWLPVMAAGALRGVLLVAAQDTKTALPRALAEAVAAELALLLEWEEQSRVAEERKADLELNSRVQQQLTGASDGRQLLQEIVDSCTLQDVPQGIGAVFALIGERRTGLAVAAPSGALAAERLQVCALSGETAWGHSVERGPLEMFWRQAVETGKVTGAEASALPLAKGVARIAAFPLIFDGRAHGVLLAGLPRGRSLSKSMERLERRALLAAQALQHEARLAEHAQLQSWRKALLESSEQAVLLLDRHGFLRGMSRGAAGILARDAAAAAVRWDKPEVRFAEVFRPRDWERSNRWLQSETPAAGEPEESLRVHLKEGTEVACRRLHLPSDQYLAVSVERAAAAGERRKEEVEEELRQTVNWMEEGVALFDEAGGLRAANERFHRLLGLSSQEAAEAKNFEDLLRLVSPHARDPEQFERTWRALAESPEGETQEELEMSWPMPQTIERCSREIVGPGGRRLGRLEVYREMTARRMFQSRMAQTEKLASLGQRVSGIVHDLSNPLTTILGYAQRLLPRVAAAESALHRELRGILTEAERATGILRQLLRLSGEARGAREPLALNELLDRTVEVMRAALSGSAVRLLVEKEPGLPPIEGDFGQLQQVLLNLLQNAQQAIEQSGKGSLIGVRTAGAGEGRVRLEVWDDGPGIPGAIQARIFDPFFTTKPPGVGTGLGLAIVLGFVRQHGGTVNVISSPRGGTRFLVELPAAPPARSEPAPAPAVVRFAPRTRPTGNGRPGEHRAPKVLVVEDEPTVGGLIADVLRDEGMRVDVLRDGHAALDRAEAENYDLAICDLKMPGMDGQNFFHSLGQRHNPLQGHVLFVTGDVVTPRTQEFLERHHLPYVAKPFRVEELSRAVHELL